MRGAEFIRRIKAHVKEKGFACEWHPDLGKGSPGVLTLATVERPFATSRTR